jgi:hypothetical protein
MPVDDTNTTISFRLPAALHDEVIRLADASGVTKHQLARTLIVRALESADRSTSDTDLSGVDDAFELIQATLVDLRVALGRGIGAILQDVSPTRDRNEIRKWVFERIITPSIPPHSEGGGRDESR